MSRTRIPKEYKLKTIKDMVDVVNEENIEFFITDLIDFFKLQVQLKKIEEFGVEIDPIIRYEFPWIDDEKTGFSNVILSINKKL